MKDILQQYKIKMSSSIATQNVFMLPISYLPKDKEKYI